MAEDGKKDHAPPPPKKFRKKKHHHAHHGGAWKVAYADFITTMMALFLLLWLLSTAEQADKTMVSLYFRDPGIFESPEGPTILKGSGGARISKVSPVIDYTGKGAGKDSYGETIKNMESLATAIKKELEVTGLKSGVEKRVAITSTKEEMQIKLADSDSSSLFMPGTAVLNKESEEIVMEVCLLLSQLTDYIMTVSGHTDSEPPKNSRMTSRDLSADRAQAIVQMMMLTGLSSSQIKEVIGYGDYYLADKLNPLAPHNRRIVISIRKKDTAKAFDENKQETEKNTKEGDADSKEKHKEGDADSNEKPKEDH